jgi:glycosyltransferase involved in cell wall biosynthesis
MSTRIVHLTSVHPPHDNRIFQKECVSAAQAGFEVFLVAPALADKTEHDVRLIAVPVTKRRIIRMTATVWHVFRKAWRLDADIYHFHDPELIPVGLLLRARGKKVVYDVHEDYVTSLQQKGYMPKAGRTLLAILFGGMERLCAKAFDVVIAERYYSRFFPRSTLISNYPDLATFDFARSTNTTHDEQIHLLYTGTVSVDRGAIAHARLVTLDDKINVTCVGRCSKELAAQMRDAAGDASGRLIIVGEGEHVPFSLIADYYRQDKWTAGLALFPLTPHYLEKELTKFFEYMSASMPILCSDFPTWRQLVEDNAVGYCVDPDDENAILDAIRKLTACPKEAESMGAKGQFLTKEQYNWASQALKLQQLYDRLSDH